MFLQVPRIRRQGEEFVIGSSLWTQDITHVEINTRGQSHRKGRSARPSCPVPVAEQEICLQNFVAAGSRASCNMIGGNLSDTDSDTVHISRLFQHQYPAPWFEALVAAQSDFERIKIDSAASASDQARSFTSDRIAAVLTSL